MIPMNSLLSWHWLWIILAAGGDVGSISVVGSFFPIWHLKMAICKMILGLPLCFPIVGTGLRQATLEMADGHDMVVRRLRSVYAERR